MNSLLVNWRTTVWGLTPLIPYALNFFGVWPTIIPLPPFDQIWPVIAASVGIGATAKDHNVTGA